MNFNKCERHLARYGVTVVFLFALTAAVALATEDPAALRNARACAIMSAERADSAVEARTLAILHIAQVVAMRSRAGASDGARALAASAAAHRALASLYPAKAAELDGQFATAVAAEDARTKSDDLAAGEAAAVTILSSRKDDGSAALVPDGYRPITSRGVYVSTSLPVWTNYPAAKPFVLSSTAQFRPGPPPDLTSPIFCA